MSLTYKEPYVTTLAMQYVKDYLENQYQAVLNQISAIEDMGFTDQIKMNKIVDVVEQAASAKQITETQAKHLLKQYGLL